jgi:HK97 gp10 family phage protein
MARSGQVRGLREFVQFTETLSADVEEQAKEVVKTATLKTEADAKLLAPVDTGYMRNSITSTFSSGGMVGTVSVGAEYGLFVEFGTSRQPAQPFIFPSFHSNVQEFLANLQRLIDRAGE